MVSLFYSSDVFEPRYDMDQDWEQYHQLNVILLSAIGLWPYGNKVLHQLQCFIGSFFTTVCLGANLATFITLDYTLNLLLKNAPCILVGCAMFLKYMSYLASSDCIKRITENINDDWKNLSSKEEIRIVDKYAERGKFHTKGFAIFICPAALFVILVPMYSVFLDIVMPLNETRNRNFPIMFETFYDQQKYFFVTVFGFEGVIITGALTFVSTETLLIVYVQHACALFEVTSYRIKKLLCATGIENSSRNSNLELVAQVVEIHSRAIRYCKIIRENFLRSYLFLLAIGILSLSSHLFRLTQSLETFELIEGLTSCTFSLAILGYIFYLNFVLQDVLDSSLEVFDVLYESDWYKFPASTQKLILFCMLSTTKPISMDLSGLYNPSYEGFSMIVKVVVSYTTALYSLQ